MASQITGVPIVYSTVCSRADQRKHQKLRVTETKGSRHCRRHFDGSAQEQWSYYSLALSYRFQMHVIWIRSILLDSNFLKVCS